MAGLASRRGMTSVERLEGGARPRGAWTSQSGRQGIGGVEPHLRFGDLVHPFLEPCARFVEDAGRSSRGTVAQAAAYDPIAVGECFDNVEQLNGLVRKLGELAQRIADSRLVWLSDAWRPSLSVYAAAKALATRQGALRTLVQALSPVFANPKSTKKGTREVRAEDIEAGIAD
jgi:hypothetical protein